MQLADLGAEVVRVEPPKLAGQASLVIGEIGLSRGKQSVTLDQRHPRAKEVFLRLAKGSDVLVENAKPGAMSARGFGYSQVAEVAPRLIWCSITGFGQDGPYADRGGHDLSYLGHSGMLAALAGDLPWHPGAMLSVPVGAMMGALGIVSALLERSRSGKGCQIDISLAEASTWLLAGASHAFTGDGGGGISMTPERRLYLCADGRHISVAAAEPRTWAALCEGLVLPELASKVRPRGAEGEAIAARLAAVFATRPADEWVAELGPRGAAVNAVNRGRDVVEDSHYRSRQVFVDVAGGSVPGNPVRLRDHDGRRSCTATEAPPTVGQHTDKVLGDIGFSADEISGLRADGVI